MTTSVGSGAVDNAPDTGGAGDTAREEAPDVRQGAQHVPGERPAVNVLDGPAFMQVGAKKKSSDKKR